MQMVSFGPIIEENERNRFLCWEWNLSTYLVGITHKQEKHSTETDQFGLKKQLPEENSRSLIYRELFQSAPGNTVYLTSVVENGIIEQPLNPSKGLWSVGVMRVVL